MALRLRVCAQCMWCVVVLLSCGVVWCGVFYNVSLVRFGPAAVSPCSVANATCKEFVWGLRVWENGDCPNATDAKKDGANCLTIRKKEYTTTTTHTHFNTTFSAYTLISISIAITFPIAIIFTIIVISTGIASGQ